MKPYRLWPALLALSFLSGCATAPATTQTTPPPVTVPAAELPKPKVALVLGGGAARGFAHIGVIRTLEREHIPVDMVVGTSVGSLIGALYASSKNSFELEWTAFTLQKEDLFDYRLMGALTGLGFVKGDKIEDFIRAKVPQPNIENLKLPFAAVATDLNRGQQVVLDHGSVARAVHASSAIPGVFEPVRYQGKLLVDGGLMNNIPVSVARDRGADIVIAVDISENVANFHITNIVDVSLQAVNIMFAQNVKNQIKGADVVIAPPVGDVAMLDFTQKKRCMEAGVMATQKAIPLIRQKIEAWGRKKLLEQQQQKQRQQQMQKQPSGQPAAPQ